MPFSRDMGHVCTLYQGKRGWNCWQRGGYDWLMGKETNHGGCRPQLLIIFGANSCGERRRQEQATERADARHPARPPRPPRGRMRRAGVYARTTSCPCRRVQVSISLAPIVCSSETHSRPFLVMASSVLKQVCIIPDSVQHQY